MTAVLVIAGIIYVLIEYWRNTVTSKELHEEEPSPESREVLVAEKSKGNKAEKVDIDAILQEEPIRPIKRRRISRKRTRPIKYKAVQVIAREEGRKVPLGTHAKGVLLAALDTRDKGRTLGVLLPEGVRFNGEVKLPPRTRIFGFFDYPGKGKKVFFRFDRAVLPNGRQIGIQARGSAPGKYNSGRLGKNAAVLGLSMAAAMGEVLTQKQALGGYYGEVSAKSTFKNALYSGSSKVAQMEAERRAREANQASPYVEIAADTAFKVIFQ